MISVVNILAGCCGLLLVVGNATTVECDDNYECAYESIDNGGSYGEIECYGDHSCFADESIETDSSGYIECHGAYSCANSDSIYQASASTELVQCYGLYSCSNIKTQLKNIGYNIQCYGEKSCSNVTQIYVMSSSGETTGDLECDGDKSCSHVSSIYFKDTLHADGHLSMYNSIIRNTNSYSKYTAYFNFYGAFSGYNGKILCKSSDTCKITCVGNGCNNLTAQCSSSSCTIDIDCDSSEMNQLCPNGYKPIIPLPNLVELGIELSTYDNSYYPCFTPYSDGISCNDYLECESQSLNTYNSDHNHGPVCCTASHACYSLKNISTYLDFGNGETSKYVNNTAVRCDGFYSCYASGVPLVTINAVNGGNIYFSGYQAAIGSSLTEISTFNKGYNISCGGRESCSGNTMTDFDTVFCNGYSSCYQITVFNGHTVYGYGGSSIRNSEIYAIDDAIYCGGYQSCQTSIIHDNSGNLFGYNYQSLADCIIANMTQSIIYSYGVESMANVKVFNVSTIVADSDYVLYGAQLEFIHNGINISGDYALYQSQLTNVFSTINITGYQALTNALITNDVNTFLVNGVKSSIIYCNYQQSCRFSTIYGFTQLFANGDNSLLQATLITNGFTQISNANVSITINGTMNALYDVYVNETDSVQINCTTANACGNMWLHCYGQCFVYCNKTQGIKCPITNNYLKMGSK